MISPRRLASKGEHEKIREGGGPVQILQVVREYLPYCIPLWKRFLLILVLTPLATTVINAALPLLSVLFIDDAVQRLDLPAMFYFVFLIFLTSLLREACRLIEAFVRYDIKKEILRRIGRDFYDHLLHLSLGFHASKPVGERIFRAFTDVHDASRGIAVSMPTAVSTCIQGVVAATLAALLDWRCVATLLLFLPPYFWFSNRVVTLWRKKDREVRETRQRVTTQLQQTLANPHIVKASTQEVGERNKYQRALSNYQRSFFQWSILSGVNEGFIHPAGFATAFSFLASASWGYFYIAGVITLGQWTALQLLLNNILVPSATVVLNYQVLRREMVSAERVLEILDLQPNVPEKEKPVRPKHIEGRIEFRNVSFSYVDSKPVLEDIDLTIEPGTTVAFVGNSGSGKSALLGLILRFYDPDTGEIHIDGTDLRDYSTTACRKRIGVVLQNPKLFAGSVRDNLLYGTSGVDEETIWRALDIAECSEFVRNLPEGLDTVMVEKGSLSGGQTQRLTLARALVRQPDLLVLDEPLASVDIDTELRIGKKISEWSKGKTVLIATHNLLNIQTADRIVVLDQGRIVETGTHEELVESGGLYRELFDSGFRKRREAI